MTRAEEEITAGNHVPRVPIPVDALQKAVHRMTATARLADMFAAIGPDREPVLHMVWAVDHENRYTMTETAIPGPEYPSLSDIDPAAFVEECEIYEQFGLRPAGGKPLNRFSLPPHAGPDFPRLGHAPAEEAGPVRASLSVAGHAFEFPFGPVRAAGFESLYYGLVTSGEEVVDLYLFTWHKHRGIEYRLRGQDPRRALFLVERAEGFSAVAHGWAFAQAVEQALDITPSLAATRVRAAALEMERLYNHAAAIVALCQSTGLSVGQAGAEIALERLLRLNAAIFGHRYLFGVVDIGGVSRPVDLESLRTALPAVCGELQRVTDGLNTTNSFLDRLESTGIVTSEQATRLGLVGPVARASGLSLDTRRDHPQPPYDVHPVLPEIRAAGDAMARYQVMLAEINASARLITATKDMFTTLLNMVGN